MAATRRLNFKSFKRTLVDANRLQLTPTNIPIMTSDFEIYPSSGNAGNIFLGDITVDTTNWLPRAKDTRTNFSSKTLDGEVKYWDLSKLYIIGTAGDSIIVQYWFQED